MITLFSNLLILAINILWLILTFKLIKDNRDLFDIIDEYKSMVDRLQDLVKFYKKDAEFWKNLKK